MNISRKPHQGFTGYVSRSASTMNSYFLATLPRQLRYWSLHCTLNALPSFCIAILFFKLWEKPIAIAAMLVGVATFILLYATLTSIKSPFSDQLHLSSRALKLGASIRAWISGLSLLVVFTPAASILPDFWCGFLAVLLVDSFGKTSDTEPSFELLTGTDNVEFIRIYVITLVEGFILSAILLTIAYFAVIFLQARDRRKVFEAGAPR